MTSESSFKIFLTKKVIKQDIPKLSKANALKIEVMIYERLTIDPLGFGKPLRNSLSGVRSLRCGDYRILYMIKTSPPIVTIIAIGHRRHIYELAGKRI